MHDYITNMEYNQGADMMKYTNIAPETYIYIYHSQKYE